MIDETKIKDQRPPQRARVEQRDRDFYQFERAFSGGGASMYETCVCGRTFYDDSSNHWDWEDGEFERVEALENSKGLNYAVEQVLFEGTWYVMDCDCWHERAKLIMAFLDAHRRQIGEYFKLERERLKSLADSYPEDKNG